MKLQLESVVRENERLHRELKDAVEKQLEALPAAAEPDGDPCADAEAARSLRAQLQLSLQEKAQAVQLWQAASQELDRLQALYQERMTEAHLHVAESQKQKDQLTGFQHLTEHLHAAHKNMELTNRHVLRAVAEQSAETDQLRLRLRQARRDLRASEARAEELAREAAALRGQAHRKEAAAASAQGRLDASDRRAQELQTSIKQLESRLHVATQEAGQLRMEKTQLEKQARELRAKCAQLEAEALEAVVTARNSLQLLEDAHLQKSRALFEEKQRADDVQSMRGAVCRLLQDAALRTRKEVTAARKQHLAQVSRLSEELSALQLECAEKQSQVERALREKKAVEEELDKAQQQARAGEGEAERSRLEEARRRCLAAELAKDDLQRSLRAAETRARRAELRAAEELARCQDTVRRLQDALEAEREGCGAVSEQRLQLQREKEQLQREAEALRRAALEAQKAAKVKVSAMEQELSVKERGFAAQLQEAEDAHRQATAELRQLLAAQQKAARRWRDDARRVAERAEATVGGLRTELSRQKHRAQELLAQLETATAQAAESEKRVAEHQERAGRLQRRAAAAERQLGAATVQRRAVSMTCLDSTSPS